MITRFSEEQIIGILREAERPNVSSNCVLDFAIRRFATSSA